MRGSRYSDAYDDAPRPVVAFGMEFPGGHVVAPHRHGRAQLLYGANGVMTVTTAQGVWVVPPTQAMWIPAGVVHGVEMLGPISTRSAYFSADAVAGLPVGCAVLGLSPLMQQLLQLSIDVPTEYDADSREGLIMALLLKELGALPVLPLSLAMPRDARLLKACKRYLAEPRQGERIDSWASALQLSRRSFTRLFRDQTGLSFAAWCQQACLFAALPRLAAGEAVTAVAMDLGYDSPAAFTSMFRRVLGVPPSRYL